MSEAHNTPDVTEHVSEPITNGEPAIKSETPAIESHSDETVPARTKAGEDEAPAVEGKTDDSAVAAEKIIEPISEGQLTYKGPGLLK